MNSKYFFLIATILLSAVYNVWGFSGQGSGTESDPYQITTLTQLQEMKDDLDASYELMNNINAADTWNWNVGDHDNDPNTPDSAMGFLPVGVSNYMFEGSFDGQNYKIDSLYINRPTSYYIGLFGAVDQVSIKGIKMTNCRITGNIYVAGLIGYDNYTVSSISNCSVSGVIVGNKIIGGVLGYANGFTIDSVITDVAVHAIGDYAGGLVGDSYNLLTIKNSSASGRIEGEDYVGGIVGELGNNSSISFSFSEAKVKGEQYIGGLVGNNKGTISKCFARDSVQGTSKIGGLVGKNYSLIAIASVERSYSSGAVVGTQDTGGLIGVSVSSGSETKASFWDTQTSGQTTSAGGTGKTTSEMKTKSTFTDAGWNFDFIWDIDNDYPVIDIDYSARPTDNDNNGYIEISTLSHLKWLSETDLDVSKDKELKSDINAADTKNWNGGDGFLPIISSGNFKGNNYTIDSLFINRPNTEYVGLFSKLDLKSNDTISGLFLTNCDITGGDKTGTLIGYAKDIIVENCTATGKVKGASEVGGLIGYARSSSIKTSGADVNVSGTGIRIGGFAGHLYYGSVNKCYSTGDVESTNANSTNIGGFAGSFNDPGCSESYSAGKVSTVYGGGGFAGSYNQRNITKDCYWNKTDNPNLDDSEGGNEIGIMDRTKTQLKTKSNYINWDFDSTWVISATLNDGFPFIRPQDSTIGLKPSDTDSDGYYNISSLGHLRWVSENDSSWAWNYELDNDIKSGHSRKWNNGAGFKPIGNTSKKFTGKFDGHHFAIDSLYINTSTEAGLFGYTQNAEIVRLRLTDCDIKGANTGAMVGCLIETDIDSCGVSGRIRGTTRTGGFAGNSVWISGTANSTIENSYSRCTVYASHLSGGFIGFNAASDIKRCFATGDITGEKSSHGQIGGFSGFSSQSFQDCYATGSVSDSSMVGGFIGNLDDWKHLSNCYSTGEVIGDSDTGGLVGKKGSNSNINNCYWDTESSGMTTSDGGTGKTNDEMKTQSTYANWDFTDTWGLSGAYNKGYPSLRWQFDLTSRDTTAAEKPEDTDGDGFYNISKLAHLRWISENDSSCTWNFELDNDINAAETRFWNVGNHDNDTTTPDSSMGWDPIGNSYSIPGFQYSGFFKGNNYKIDSLYSFRTDSLVGFFETIDSGKVYDLGITNCNFRGEQVGGLVAINNSSIINNCITSGKIGVKRTPYISSGGVQVGGAYYDGKAGGLMAYSALSKISNCQSNCSIKGINYLGGLLGQHQGRDTVTNCSATGNVTADSAYIGGFVGYNGFGTYIDSCQSSGNVSGFYYVGGFAGICKDNSISENNPLIVKHCSATGNVTADSAYIGGFVGYNKECHISNSYAKGNVEGEHHVGGFGGSLSYSNLSECFASGAAEGDYRIGGFAGHFGAAVIDEGYASGSVSGNNYIGGFIGISGSSTVRRCYSVGKVTGSSNASGFLNDNGYGTYANNFWDIETSGKTTSTGATGKTTTQMKTQSTFTNWDFSSIWAIDSTKNSGYPYLQWQSFESTSSKLLTTKQYLHGLWNGTTHEPTPILCELRTGTDLITSNLTDCLPAIIDSTGEAKFDFADVSDGDYWLVLRAGSYLPLGSTSKIALSSTKASYDFTTTYSKAAGGDKALYYDGTDYMMRGGDFNNDSRSSATDVPILSTSYGKSLKSYLPNAENTIYSGTSSTSKEVAVQLYMHGLWDGTKHATVPLSCEIRSGSDLLTSTLVKRVAGLVDTTGIATFDFGDAADGTYWIVVRAAGYLPLGATGTITLSTTKTSYDFTLSLSAAAGGDKALYYDGTDYLMRGGDFNNDNRSSATDIPVMSTSYGKSLKSYVPAP